MGRYYHMKESWTPLSLIGIRFFKTNEKELFIKVGKKRRRRINRDFS